MPAGPRPSPQSSDGISVCGFQNQLLTKGMVILRDKIRFYEGESGGPVAGTGRPATLPAGVAAGRRDVAGLFCAPRALGGRAGEAARPRLTPGGDLTGESVGPPTTCESPGGLRALGGKALPPLAAPGAFCRQ